MKVLVTGSTGFIGKRLIHLLLEQGAEVYALTRLKGISLQIPENGKFHQIYGDLSVQQSSDFFPEELDAAYYLLHSMGDAQSDLIDIERKIAHNFISLIEQTNCKQIIFLSGIIEDELKLSPHLLSRLSVEKILQSSKVPYTILRSSIIIGAGSASFEIIRDLVEKLPVMIAPKWVKNYSQPISISDVLFYLKGVLLNPNCFRKIFDIGGPEAITFKQILLRYAHFRKLRRFIIDVPVLTPRLSSYWLVFITSVKFSICKYLVESMKQDTRKISSEIDRVLPHPCLTFEESLYLAFQKIEQNEVISTWMDAWDPKTVSGNIEEFIEVPHEGCLKDEKVIPITIPIEEVRQRIWSIGGKRGWYSLNWAWRIRGLIDQAVGGTGQNRGRRDPDRLIVGDSIDFWRVILADKEKGHLILYAEMKLPGEAWLEFVIDTVNRTLKQTATFRPKGLWGHFYWYLMYPLHLIIFKNMAKNIAQKGDKIR